MHWKVNVTHFSFYKISMYIWPNEEFWSHATQETGFGNQHKFIFVFDNKVQQHWHKSTKHADSKNAINDKSIYMYRKSRWLHNFLEDMMLELIELVLADQLAREGKRTNGIVCRWGSLQHSHRSHHTHSFNVFASPYIRRSSSCPLWRNKKPECPVKNSWSKHPV